MRRPNWIRNLRVPFGFLKSGRFWTTVLVCLGIVSLVLSIVFREWLVNDFWSWLGNKPAGQEESNSATLRNVGLVIAAIVALPLAIWRSVVGSRQAGTSQHSLQNERYQKGAEMLGNNVLSVRLGGIYALRQLSDEHPEQYHVQVMRLFCAFARHPTGAPNKESGFVDYETVRIVDADEGPASVRRLRPDVEAVMEAIAARTEAQIVLEREAAYKPNLSYADLRHLWLNNANLSGVILVKANLSGAILYEANFSDAELFEADLSGARLNCADFSGATLSDARLPCAEAKFAIFTEVYFLNVNLTHADLSGADLTGAKFVNATVSGTFFYKDGVVAEGLTQRQFQLVRVNPDDPPVLDGLTDSETGHAIDWDKIRKVVDW